MIPSLGLNPHLEPAEFQIAVKLWLGIAVTDIPVRTFLPIPCFGPFRPPCLYMQAHGRCGVAAQQAQGCPLRILPTGLFWVLKLKQEVVWGMKDIEHGPADILIPLWDLGKPAALDLTVTSTLNSSTLMEAGVTSGSAAQGS